MPSLIKATAVRIPAPMKERILTVGAEAKKSTHAAILMLLEEALIARSLPSTNAGRIISGLKEVEVFVDGKTEAQVYSPRTGVTKLMNVKQAKAEQAKVAASRSLRWITPPKRPGLV